MQKVLVVIPLFNHASKVGAVIDGVMAGRAASGFDCLVLDDGSTDNAADVLAAALARHPEGLHVLRHERNRGKGRAILSAAAWAEERGFSHIVTLDADGQHLPEELPLFFEAITREPQTLWVGYRDFSGPNVPSSSAFGRAFSAFWLRVQTGVPAPDVQSGFRAYPVGLLRHLSLGESHYSFETEVLVRAAWAGFRLGSLPIKVYYPPRRERVSHFNKLKDNIRISILNTRLTIRALVPVPFTQHETGEGGRISARRPLASLRILLGAANTPGLLALSTFVAVLVNMLPTPGFQSLLLLFFIGWLKLNRVWALAVSHLCWPPLVIALCIEAGHFIRHGEFLTEISWQTLGREGLQRIWEWVVGGVVFGPVFAFVCGAAVYLAALYVNRQINRRLPGGEAR